MDEGREQKSVKSERESALSFERSFVVVVVAWGGQMAPHARVAFNFFSTIFFLFFLLFYARDVNILTRNADFITAHSYAHTQACAYVY